MRYFIIAVFIFILCPIGWAQSANLINVRTGHNDQFTRIVFEFQEKVFFEKPEIKEEGIFSLVFLDSTTTLPPIKSVQTGPQKLVRSIEFVQQESNLMAAVQLSMPFSSINCFSLSDPDRVVVDAYQIMPHKKKTEYYPSLNEISAPPPALLETHNLTSQQIKDQSSEKTLMEKNMATTVPPSVDSMKSTNKLYLLAIFNALTSLILLLIIFMLLKQKRSVPQGNILEIVGFIKRSDTRMRIINDRLKREIKKIEELNE